MTFLNSMTRHSTVNDDIVLTRYFFNIVCKRGPNKLEYYLQLEFMFKGDHSDNPALWLLLTVHAFARYSCHGVCIVLLSKLQDPVSVFTKCTIDGWMTCDLRPFQQYFSHIRTYHIR